MAGRWRKSFTRTGRAHHDRPSADLYWATPPALHKVAGVVTRTTDNPHPAGSGQCGFPPLRLWSWSIWEGEAVETMGRTAREGIPGFSDIRSGLRRGRLQRAGTVLSVTSYSARICHNPGSSSRGVVYLTARNAEHCAEAPIQAVMAGGDSVVCATTAGMILAADPGSGRPA